MIDAEHKKTHTISIESVINELEKSDEYKDRFQLCHTHFQQDKDRWNQRRKFEDTLATELNNGKGIKYFAYIKFYLDKDKKYALVAGKSGSRLVNVKSDVCFRVPFEVGKAVLFCVGFKNPLLVAYGIGFPGKLVLMG